jgi:hypothetical protein
VCVWERETEREERSRDAKEARDYNLDIF